jgi:hypothetical protein
VDTGCGGTVGILTPRCPRDSTGRQSGTGDTSFVRSADRPKLRMHGRTLSVTAFRLRGDRVAVDLAGIGAIHIAMSGYRLFMGRASLRATGTISADAEQDRAG